jgi:hypothetical protein
LGTGLAGWYGVRAVHRFPSSRDSSIMRKTFTCKIPSLKFLRVNTRQDVLNRGVPCYNAGAALATAEQASLARRPCSLP